MPAVSSPCPEGWNAEQRCSHAAYPLCLPWLNQTPQMGRYNPIVVHGCLSEVYGRKAFVGKPKMF